MKKHILALAVVGALGVSSLTAASPSNAPAVAVQAEVGGWLGRVAADELNSQGFSRTACVRVGMRAAGTRIGRSFGRLFGRDGAKAGAAIGAL